MKLLALDTSSAACSVAVQSGDDIVLRHEVKAREHTRLLLPMIRSALQEAALELPELDAVVLGNGPGSFIGMRIAASVAQGLAYAAELPIVPVSSMAAVAAAVFSEEQTAHAAITQDAHMGEVYLGLYKRDRRGLPLAVIPERLQARQSIAELSQATGWLAAGAGWQRYPDLLSANEPAIERLADCLYPHAQHLLALGRAAWSAGEAVQADAVTPAYLRQEVAKKQTVVQS